MESLRQEFLEERIFRRVEWVIYEAYDVWPERTVSDSWKKWKLESFSILMRVFNFFYSFKIHSLS